MSNRCSTFRAVVDILNSQYKRASSAADVDNQKKDSSGKPDACLRTYPLLLGAKLQKASKKLVQIRLGQLESVQKIKLSLNFRRGSCNRSRLETVPEEYQIHI